MQEKYKSQKKREKYFDDTLLDFYQNSNEIELHSEFFNKQILPELNKCSKLNWLEVGVGKGEKLINHLKGFKKKPNLTIIEPSKVWLDKLNKSLNINKLYTLCSKVTIINSTFEKFNETLFVSDFDYISFNQVIYDDSIFQDLKEFIDSSKNRGPYWIHINLENETSDLYVLRQKLQKEFQNVSLSQIIGILEYLEKNNFEYCSFDTTNKLLNLEIEKLYNDFSYWFYPFILGISSKMFEEISIQKKETLKTILLGYIGSRKQIKINDTSLIVKINNL